MDKTTALVVRAITAADEAALAQLFTEFNGLPITAEQMHERLLKSRGIEYPVIAQLGEVVVGFASLRLVHYLGEDAPYAELSELYVQSAYRRQGVARALRRWAFARFRSRYRSGLVMNGLTVNNNA